jgi:FkbM family methyltransferase
MTHLSRAELERHARGVLTVERVGGSIVRARVLGVFDLFVDEGEQSLAPYLLDRTRGLWEPATTRAISRYVRPGMVCVDGGAHWGYFSLLLAVPFGAARVIAVEPQDAVRPLLERGVAENGLGSLVHIDPRALWDSSGAVVELHVPGDYLGSTTITGPPFGASFTKAQLATTITLDDLLDELEIAHVDFVKLDTEGSEARIWRGMRRTWKRNPELVVLAEYFTAPEGPELLRELRESGARIRRVNDEGDVIELAEQGVAPYTMLWVTRS